MQNYANASLPFARSQEGIDDCPMNEVICTH